MIPRVLSTIFLLSFIFTFPVSGQSYRNNSSLRLEDIMKGEQWMGSSPADPYWSADGKRIFFTWNPSKELLSSDYTYNLHNGKINKTSINDLRKRVPREGAVYSADRKKILFIKEGNLYLFSEKEDSSKLMLDLTESISSPFFSAGEQEIYFRTQKYLMKYDPVKSKIETIAAFIAGEPEEEEKYSNEQEEWLYRDQMNLFDVLRRDTAMENLEKRRKEEIATDRPYEIYTGEGNLFSIEVSKDERYIIFLSFHENSVPKKADMPRFITESGFTGNEEVRPKVGYPYGSMQLGIYDTLRDSLRYADLSGLPGIYTYTVYGEEQDTKTGEEPREVYISTPVWSGDRTKAVLTVRSTDNKDRWICRLDPDSAVLVSLDRQRDEAWVAGPGIGWSTSGGVLDWIDDHTIYFQSEEKGYSHLFSYDLLSDKKTQLTAGDFEVYDPVLSADKKYFYFSSNEEHYGERHFYRMEVNGGKRQRLTYMKGRNDVLLSPDEKKMLIRHSYANKPWELYICDLSPRKPAEEEARKITDSYSDEFKSYQWREPEFIRFRASDGEMVPARLYRPSEEKKNGAAVIFVHGAGYLQNAHKWWSSYYREYMFHNFLVDNGYTVLDTDYRGSAGYGRDWRTAIYRHMGGRDLADNVDAASYLMSNEDIDSSKIGIYGGSYGGFITLMALFKSPGTFSAGAALRPVTDWAHYNHGYTSNILNTPAEDSLAYHRSSPIYFADGLQDHLVMCHGMVDDNVHFQDVVRLSQKLIELRKDNWQLAVYPVEAHGFEKWTSWLDEYKRVYRIFEENCSGK